MLSQPDTKTAPLQSFSILLESALRKEEAAEFIALIAVLASPSKFALSNHSFLTIYQTIYLIFIIGENSSNFHSFKLSKHHYVGKLSLICSYFMKRCRICSKIRRDIVVSPEDGCSKPACLAPSHQPKIYPARRCYPFYIE